ncbi:MAG: isocitrate lyase/PEP mutase family protein [Micromonosporaceae bacterium]
MSALSSAGQSAARRLRERLADPSILVLPGVADAITARVVQQCGFDAAYVTGAGFSNASLGMPDVGLVTLSEIATHVQRVAEVSDIPLIVDADTGYGGVLNVRRTVRQLEHAGAAAIQLEDQATPKRCGHFGGNTVVSEREMLQRLHAALDARHDPDLVIIARTDAREAEGFDSAVRRARAYAAAGADMIFVEALRNRDELREVPKLVDAPLIANMVEGGKTPLLDSRELEALGFRVALFANTALRAAMKAVWDAMRTLRAEGGTKALLDQMINWDQRQQLVDLPGMQALEDRYLKPPEQ